MLKLALVKTDLPPSSPDKNPSLDDQGRREGRRADITRLSSRALDRMRRIRAVDMLGRSGGRKGGGRGRTQARNRVGHGARLWH